MAASTPVRSQALCSNLAPFSSAGGPETGDVHLVPPQDSIAGSPVHLEFRACHFLFAQARSSRSMVPVRLRPYDGDWHAGVDVYKQWRKSWYQPAMVPRLQRISSRGMDDTAGDDQLYRLCCEHMHDGVFSAAVDSRGAAAVGSGANGCRDRQQRLRQSLWWVATTSCVWDVPSGRFLQRVTFSKPADLLRGPDKTGP